MGSTNCLCIFLENGSGSWVFSGEGLGKIMELLLGLMWDKFGEVSMFNFAQKHLLEIARFIRYARKDQSMVFRFNPYK